MATETSEGKTVLIGSRAELDNFVNYRRGYKPTTKERPVLVYKAIEHGVMCDGHLLVEDKEATQKIVGKYIEKEQKANIKRLMENAQISEEEATKRLKRSWEELSREGTYPNYKQLYPKRIGREAKIIGISKDGVYGGPAVRAYLSDGKHIVAADAEKLAFILKHLPNAKIAFSSKNPTTSPLTFITHKGKKGLLMPIFIQGDLYTILAKTP